MPADITSGVEANDRLIPILAHLPPDSEHREAVKSVQAWALASDGRATIEKLFLDVRSEMKIASADRATLTATLQTLGVELEAWRKLFEPLVHTAMSRIEWSKWLQSPGKARELAWLLAVIISLLSGHLDALSALTSTSVASVP